MLFNTHISLICSWYCYHIVCLQYTYCISYANYILKLLTIRGQSIICFNTICLNLQFHERHFMRDISYTKLRYWYILTIWNPEIWSQRVLKYAILGPVVQTPINANTGLDLPNLGLTFNLRLICVARSLINANPGLKGGRRRLNCYNRRTSLI